MKSVFDYWYLTSVAETFRRQKQKQNCCLKWQAVCEDSRKLQKFAVQFCETHRKSSIFSAWFSCFKEQVTLLKTVQNKTFELKREIQQQQATAKEAVLLERLNIVKLRYRLKDWRAVLTEKKAQNRKARTLEKVKNWIQDFRKDKMK